MRLLFDADQVRDDPAHWDTLAERVAANVLRGSNGSGFAWLARSRTSWIAASLLVAAAVAFMLSETESATKPSAEWEQALAPADAVGKALVMQNAPPAVGALLLSGASGG